MEPDRRGVDETFIRNFVPGEQGDAIEGLGAGAVAGASGEMNVDCSDAVDDVELLIVNAYDAAQHTEWNPEVTAGEEILEHGAVTGGPFQVEQITGADSGATADVKRVPTAGGFLQVDNIVGTFENGEVITGGTSSATANLASTVPGAKALDDPLRDQRRIMVAVARDYVGVVLVDTTAVKFTAYALGKPPDRV